MRASRDVADAAASPTQVEAVDCEFSHNRVVNATHAAGGALHLTNSTVRLRGCQLRNNTAAGRSAQGGAVFASGVGALSLDGCTLEGNRALGTAAAGGGEDSSGGAGGAVYATGSVAVGFAETVVADSHAAGGGGGALVLAGQASCFLSRCEWRNNTVQVSCGA
jgi:hypothetical protein